MVQLTNNTGTIIWQYDYDAFGNQKEIAGQTGNDINPFRYAGEYYDVEASTYYLRARNYNPEIGRFMAEDMYWNPQNRIYGAYSNETYKSYGPNTLAILQSSNLYVYAANNPILYMDPTGEAVYVRGLSVGYGKGVYGEALFAYAWDDKGNETILITPSVGLGYGFSLSQIISQYDYLETIYEINANWSRNVVLSANAGFLGGSLQYKKGEGFSVSGSFGVKELYDLLEAGTWKLSATVTTEFPTFLITSGKKMGTYPWIDPEYFVEVFNHAN